MSATLGSFISIIFVAVGFLAVLIMLNLQGNPKEKPSTVLFRKIHRVLGYVFIIIFLLMTVFMVKKVSASTYEFPARATFHMSLAIMLIPILLTKVLIVRFFRRLYSQLISLGLSIFFLSFTLVSLTAGYHLLQSKSTPASQVSAPVQSTTKKAMSLSEGENSEVAQELLKKKCTLCHNLDRVNKANKLKEEWEITISRMVNYTGNPTHLTEEEKTFIIAYLSTRKNKPDSEKQ